MIKTSISKLCSKWMFIYKRTVLRRRSKNGLNLRLIFSDILLLHPGHLLGSESNVISTSSPQFGQNTDGRPSGWLRLFSNFLLLTFSSTLIDDTPFYVTYVYTRFDCSIIHIYLKYFI